MKDIDTNALVDILKKPPKDMNNLEASLWLQKIRRGLAFQRKIQLVSEKNYRKHLDVVEKLHAWKISEEEIKSVVDELLDYYDD